MLVLPDWIFWSLLATPIPLFIFLFMMVWAVGLKTIKAFIKAKKHHSLIAFFVRKNGTISYESGPYGEGMLDIPQGEVVINPQGVYRLPNNLPAVIVFEQYGVNLTPEVIKSTEDLKAVGFSNLAELELYQKTKMDINAGKDVEPALVKWVQTIDERLGEAKMYINSVIQSVENFLREINPALIKARIERRVAREMEGMRKTDWAKIVMLLTIFLIGASIAIFIIQSSFSSQQTPGWVSTLIKSMQGRQTRVISHNTTTPVRVK